MYHVQSQRNLHRVPVLGNTQERGHEDFGGRQPTLAAAEQMNLLISEPISNPFTHAEGQILEKLSDTDFGDIFPKKLYFFVHLQSEMG